MAAAIRMEKTAWWRIAEAHRHIERPDCQILLHPVTYRPTHDAAAMQVENDGKVEPALRCPDIGDVARPFTVGVVGSKIAVQPVCRDTQTVVAVRRNLVLARSDWLDSVDLHQSSDPALANIEPHLFQLHRHPRTTVAPKAQPVLFPDMGQHLHVCTCTLADRP